MKRIPLRRPSKMSATRARLLLDGAGIEFSSQMIPRYNWTDRISDLKSAGVLIKNLADDLCQQPHGAPDYVVVFDNGGPSAVLGLMLCKELASRYGRQVGLVTTRIIERNSGEGNGKGKRRWQIWYRPDATANSVRLRTDPDFDLVRRKKAVFFTTALEWDSRILDVAKTAKAVKNGIVPIGIACIVKRDGRIRQERIPSILGESVPVFPLVDCRLQPRWEKSGDKYSDPLPKDGLFEPRLGLLARFTRRIRNRAQAAAL